MQCGQSFEITNDDLAFYEKISPVINGTRYDIPSPTLCPNCRMQRRLAYRNERALYHRKCDLTGKQIISMYPPDAPFPVYEIREWHTDKWDPLQYGRDVDFTHSFQEQFLALRTEVPRMSLVREGDIINADYCNRVSYAKNCYLLFSSSFNEDCYYGTRVEDSRDCVDCLYVHQSERCYECVDCHNCYGAAWLQGCHNCSDSFFLKGCTGCKHCLFCTNIVQKEYCIFNKQYTKEEYERQLKDTLLSHRSMVEGLKEKFSTLASSMIVKSITGTDNERSTGDYLDHSKNAFATYDCREVEDVRYAQSLTKAKDCMDYSFWGRDVELIYETHACGLNCQRILFCNECWEGCNDLLYCDSCIGSSSLFGCTGLRHKKYCILNKQYSKEEYERLVPKIIEHMRAAREWGEPLPITASPFAYNETAAQDYFPLTKEDVIEREWRWYEETNGGENYLGPTIDISDDIANVDDTICTKILMCETTGKPYKIIPQELKFYRQAGLPIPRKCPDQRHTERMAKRNPRKLWDRACAKCKKATQTTYAPERTEIVYCEECYLQTVY